MWLNFADFVRYSYRRRLLDDDLEKHGHLFTGKILDLGESGRGRGRFNLSSALEVIRCDIEDGDTVDVVADAHNLPFKTKQFNTVKCTEVFEHLKNPGQAISEVARVLKPGGNLVLSVPFLIPIHGDPDDYQRFTPSGLHVLLGSEFSIKEISYHGGWFTVIAEYGRMRLIKIKNGVLRYLFYGLLVPILEIGVRIEQKKLKVVNKTNFALGFLIYAERK